MFTEKPQADNGAKDAPNFYELIRLFRRKLLLFYRNNEYKYKKLPLKEPVPFKFKQGIFFFVNTIVDNFNQTPWIQGSDPTFEGFKSWMEGQKIGFDAEVLPQEGEDDDASFWLSKVSVNYHQFDGITLGLDIVFNPDYEHKYEQVIEIVHALLLTNYPFVENYDLSLKTLLEFDDTELKGISVQFKIVDQDSEGQVNSAIGDSGERVLRYFESVRVFIEENRLKDDDNEIEDDYDAIVAKTF